eukprot:1390949-Rhodomonas_salina.1
MVVADRTAEDMGVLWRGWSLEWGHHSSTATSTCPTVRDRERARRVSLGRDHRVSVTVCGSRVMEDWRGLERKDWREEH